jgi:DNA replication protein DnaC
LPAGKTLASFDFAAVPMLRRAQVMALAAGDSWIENGANLLLFGPPGVGKSHLAAAIGLALIDNGWRVLFMRTGDLVSRLQIARDIAYVSKDQAETSVLFELIGSRYERRSLLINHRQSAVRRMGQSIPRSRHDARRHRSPRSLRHHPGDERRKLSPPRRA